MENNDNSGAINAQLHELFLQSSGVCTDTRKIVQGSIFFALKGETFNGNDFAEKAIEQGANYAVVDDIKYSNSCEILPDNKFIYVPNVLETLQQLARYHRLKHRIPIIAITGTNGKTTTKELITSVLKKKYNVVATEGNLNNHIGVPLTLLKINENTQVAVVEMGASAPGEIKTLVNIVCPTFGLITNVGKAHLLGFGSLEGVKQTKGELYDNLMEHKKIAFVNVDNPNLTSMLKERIDLQIVPYGVNNDMAKILPYGESDPYLKIQIPNPIYGTNLIEEYHDNTCRNITIPTHLIGNYNIDNVLAALCVGTHFGIALNEAIEAISSYIPTNNRSQMIKTSNNIIIVDAYNANPTSFKASLENFKSLDMSHKTLIIGDMLELGEESLKEHITILNLAISLQPEHIFIVGNEFKKAFEQEQLNKNISTQITLYRDVEELKTHFLMEQPKGKAFLIKGSHGIHLEKLIDIL